MIKTKELFDEVGERLTKEDWELYVLQWSLRAYFSPSLPSSFPPLRVIRIQTKNNPILTRSPSLPPPLPPIYDILEGDFMGDEEAVMTMKIKERTQNLTPPPLPPSLPPSLEEKIKRNDDSLLTHPTLPPSLTPPATTSWKATSWETKKR